MNIFFITVRRRKEEDSKEVKGVEEVKTAVVVAEAVEVVEVVEDVQAVMVMRKEEDLSIPSFCGIGGKEPLYL